MNLNDYAKFTESVNLEPTVEHVLSGLFEEVGEVAGLFKRRYRDKVVVDNRKLRKELGDVLWHVVELARINGIEPQSILDENVEKLKGRLDRGTLRGSGDNR